MALVSTSSPPIPSVVTSAPIIPFDSDFRLDIGGNYHYRVEGESHHWDPVTISTLQHAARSGRYETFKQFEQRRERSEPRG